jgi:chromosome segregation ATPase
METVAGIETHRQTHDVVELVIAGLAQEIVEKSERIASLEADVVAYRELSQQGMHALHALTAQLDRLRQQHHRLLDEYRSLRQTFRRSEAA